MASKTPTETTPLATTDVAAEKAYAVAAEAVSVAAPTAKSAAEKPVVEKAAAPKAAANKIATKKAATKHTGARKVAKPIRAAKEIASKKAATVAKPRKTIVKDKTMTAKKTNTADFAQGFQTVVADAQAKAKEAFDKGSAQFNEAGQFAKGNVEALVESGKILAAGLQQMASGATAEAKTAFETMTADVKELSTAKTPADFLRLQSDIMRRNFDAMVAYGSKNSETMMKLASDTFAPISTRVNLAVEKVRKAA